MTLEDKSSEVGGTFLQPSGSPMTVRVSMRREPSACAQQDGQEAGVCR